MNRICVVLLFFLAPKMVAACEFNIRGEITEIKAAEYINQISALPKGSEICFDSIGGSFVAGMTILKFLAKRDNTYPTRVASGAKCFSACAIAFMGGHSVGLSGVVSSKRTIEEGGKLGFHRPYLVLENAANVGAASLDRLFDELITVTFELTSMAHVFGSIKSQEVDYTWPLGRVFPATLLRRMNEVDPKDELLIVDNYENAAAYGISFAPSHQEIDLASRVRKVCDFVDRVRLDGLSRDYYNLEMKEYRFGKTLVFYLASEAQDFGKSVFVEPGCYVFIDDSTRTYSVWSDSLNEGVFGSGLSHPDDVGSPRILSFWHVGH